MTAEERSSLLDALLDGEISEADFLRLEAELTVDPEVRRQYYERLEMDLLLEEAAAEHLEMKTQHADTTSNPRADAHASLERQPARHWWLTGLLITVAASLLLMLMGPWWDGSERTADGDSPAPLRNVELSATGFAVLGGQSDAVWEGETIRPGGLLPEGELHLISGLVHIELFSGVQMVVEGDAVFSVDSPMQVTMQKGRARANVPEPAHGFRLKTASGEVVDLGTEFTVNVDGQRSEVQVVEGEVELRPNNAESQRLRDGEGLALAPGGTVTDDLTNQIDLVGPTAFQEALAKRQSTQFEKWQRATNLLREDPRLVAQFVVNPDSGWSRQLANRASARFREAGDEVAGDGAVVAAERSRDRWGRDGGALDFSRTGSRVRVIVPGEHRGLTLMCWVKINSLDRWYNSLFLTDGHEEREPHWQIMDDGRLFFSVKQSNDLKLSQAERDKSVFYSDPFWDSSMSGQWIMLATVYDVDRKRVAHYVNGELITDTEIPEPLLVDSIKIGAASICNWSEPMYRTDATFVVRNLNGSVDEFALFSGALSSQKISELFEAGNPDKR